MTRIELLGVLNDLTARRYITGAQARAYFDEVEEWKRAADALEEAWRVYLKQEDVR